MGEPNRNSTNRSGNPRSTPAYDAPPRAISACSPPWNTTTLNLYSVAVEALQGKRTLGETATPVPGLWICKVFGVIYDPEVGDADSGGAVSTAVQSIPDDWCGPICGTCKANFIPYRSA